MSEAASPSSLSSYGRLLLRAACLTACLTCLLLAALLAAFISSPTFQSLLIHMHWVNFPPPLLTDFQRPRSAQWLSPSLPCAHYLSTAANDSQQLNGWLISPASRCAQSEQQSAADEDASVSACSSVPPFSRVVLYLHGNAENRAYSRTFARYRFLTAAPLCADVFAFDYRGFGDNDGFPTQAGLEVDAAAMWRAVRQRLAQEQQQQQQPAAGSTVIVYGHSLGSAVAAHLLHRLLTAEAQQQQQDAAMLRRCLLVVEGCFTSVLDNALLYLPWPLSVSASLRSLLAASLQHPWSSDRLMPLMLSPALPLPCLLLHGRADSEIPYWNAERLWAATVATLGCSESEEQRTDGQAAGDSERRCGDSQRLVSVQAGRHYDSLHSAFARAAIASFVHDMEQQWADSSNADADSDRVRH